MVVCRIFSGNKWHCTFVNVSFLFSTVNSNIYLHSLFKITLQELYLDWFHKGYSWVSNIACGQSKVSIRAGCHVSALHQCSVPKTSDCMHMWAGTNHKSLQDRPGKLRSETSAVDSITFETDHDTAANLRVSIWFL